jgi:hypothetical protein
VEAEVPGLPSSFFCPFLPSSGSFKPQGDERAKVLFVPVC